MAPVGPQVIENIGLTELIKHLQGNDSRPSILVVCATKEQFAKQLLAACVETTATNVDQQTTDGDDEPIEAKHTAKETPSLLKQPSLLQLAQSRSVKLVFCHDITLPRAYLATLAIQKSHLADLGSRDYQFNT